MKQLTRPVLVVGSPNKVAEIRYVTGFSAPDPVVYLQHGKTRHLVVSILELERAKRVAKGITVWSPEDLEIRRQSKYTINGWILGLLRKTGITSVIVTPDFGVGIVKKLRKVGIRVKVAEESLFPQRAVKTPDELLKIRECQKAAVKAMRLAVRMIAHSRADRKGRLRMGRRVLTSEMVRSIVNKKLVDYGCIGQEVIVACGQQSADPHEAGSGPLREGESIVIDIFPQSVRHGYWGDLTRTVVKGKPSPSLKKMYYAVKSAQSAALSAIRPGVSVRTAHNAAVDLISRRGFKTGVLDGRPQGFIHSIGHGLGLEIHEPPRLGLHSTRLKRGNVITVEPGLYYPDVGGIRIEDLIVVTAAGWKYVEPCEHIFEL